METPVPSAPASAAFAGLETAEPLTPDEIDRRARDLRDRLSLEEKISLMHGLLPIWRGLAEMTAPNGYSSRIWPAGEIARLGIPGVRFSDGPRGIILDGATTFPVSMARGATFDTDLEERVGDAIGRELRALGGNYFGGVCINLLRHPAWGRAQETYGEDPQHLGAMGAALTRGVQRHVMACVKHYALNSMENARFKVDVTISPRALHEIYLPHFRRVVAEGVASVMSAYNSVNGEWAGQNRALLTDILKDAWGFDGFVVTDFIFGMRDAKTAALAGQDVEMPFALHVRPRPQGPRRARRGSGGAGRRRRAARAAPAGALRSGTRSPRLPARRRRLRGPSQARAGGGREEHRAAEERGRPPAARGRAAHRRHRPSRRRSQYRRRRFEQHPAGLCGHAARGPPRRFGRDGRHRP